MMPKGVLARRVRTWRRGGRGTSLLEACRYVDRQYFWRRRLRIPALRGPHFPQCDVTGGPKWRVFSSFLHQLLPAENDLVHQRDDRISVVGSHATTPMRLSEITGVCYTFKSLENFFARVNVNIEAIRQEHWDGVSEYARYLAKLKANPSLSFTIRAASSMKAVSN
jgi:hypothetical protein